MSVDLDVFLDRSKLPTVTALQEAISREGFPLTFPLDVDLTRHTGYMPVVFQNEESGFEWSLADLNDFNQLPDEIRVILPIANAVVSFRFSEMQESLAATVVAAVLAQLAQGLVFDPQDGRIIPSNQAIADARLIIDTAAKTEREAAAKHPERLSPLKWAMGFEKTLRRVHRDYSLSADYRGRLVECVRQDESGLFLSQNCVKVYASYRHCFATLFTRKKLSGALCSPFVLGSRFDHNTTIAHAYNRDYRSGMKWQVAPEEWHSEYAEQQCSYLGNAAMG